MTLFGVRTEVLLTKGERTLSSTARAKAILSEKGFPKVHFLLPFFLKLHLSNPCLMARLSSESLAISFSGEDKLLKNIVNCLK